MNQWVKYASKKLAYILATAIAIVALAMLTTRLLTPLVNRHRTEIESWASQLLSTDVQLARAQLGWYGYRPSVTLHNVTVFNHQTHDPILQIQKVTILFSISQSIWQRKIIPNGILISGSHINIDEEANGQISVQGYPLGAGFTTTPYHQETKFIDMMGWLSAQPSLILRDINIRLLTDKNHEQNITLYNLSFSNDDTTHRILGKAILHQEVPTEVNLAIQWVGNEPDPAKIKGQIYLYVSGLSLPQWLKDKSYQGWEIKQGLASIKLWATWKNNAWHKAQSLFQFYDVELYSQRDKKTHNLNRLSGHVGWRQDNNNYVLAADDVLIDLPEHFWPVSRLYFAYTYSAKQEIVPQLLKIGYLNLADVQTFLLASVVNIPQPVKDMLTGLQPHGGLENLSLKFPAVDQPWETAQFSTDFSQLSLLSWEHLPGVDHLSGSLTWHDLQGSLRINSTDALLEYAVLFKKPLEANQLVADIQWKSGINRAWFVTINRFQILNEDAAANLHGTMLFPPKKLPEVDLSANLAILKINHLTEYLPAKTLEPDLEAWLQSAFVKGEVKSANLRIRGSLADFPFDHGNGLFEVKSQISNVDLRYAPEWPILSHAAGELNFSGRKMLVNLNQAMIADIPLKQVAAEIPYLGADKAQTLIVKIEPVQAEAEKFLHLIHVSPLEKTFGKLIHGISLQGPATLALGLKIPLGNPDKMTVQGELNLQDAKLALIPWQFSIMHLTGNIAFTENSTQAKNLSATLFTQPLIINIATAVASRASLVNISFHTVLLTKDLQAWLDKPLTQYIDGLFPIAGEIKLSVDAPIVIDLNSSLEGAQVNLPAPYGKSAKEIRLTTAKMITEDSKPLRVKIQYGEGVAAALLLDKINTEWQLSAINFHLGTGDPSWPTAPGLYLTGRFTELDWATVKNYWQESSSFHFTGPALKSIDVTADILKINRLTIKNVVLSMQPNSTYWNIKIKSPAVDGSLRVPIPATAKAQADAQFSRLNLTPEKSGATSERLDIDISTLPIIHFAAKNVIINNVPLGQVVFNTYSTQAGLKIDNLRITNPNLDIQATGSWVQSSQGYTSNLQGRATSSQISNLLTSFGMDMRHVVLSTGEIKFSFNWADAAYALSVAKLNGQANMKLGKGRITDIGKNNSASMGFGRLLSIFSLQSIPRRLTFDFSDLFQDGYSFDDVTGDFTLRQGNANTNNLQFNGPVAKVSINGRIGLSQKDLNLALNITPFVTASIPVAATLLTGQPWVGLAALVMNTFVGSQVSKATAYYYTVTGPWDNPTWKSNDNSKKTKP